MAPKVGKNSKFNKDQDIFANWTVDGAQYAFHENCLCYLEKFLKSQNIKTTFKKNLACIFLFVRANSKK